MRNFIRQFLLYSRTERRAVIALVVLIVIVLILPKAYQFYAVKPVVTNYKLANYFTVDSLAEEAIDTDRIDLPIQLFYFDPNTATKAQWKKLGLTSEQAEGIERYIAKGGRFRKPDDLKRLYSLTDEEKVRLIPFVRISTNKDLDRIDALKIIEINTADSAAFEALEEIGPALAIHIIKYRSLLGGFCDVDQIAETRGITADAFKDIKPYLRVNPKLIKQININEADYDTLRKHPYIHAKIAHAIIAYRNTNGRFESMDELKNIKAINEQVYEKIKPYLCIGK